MLMALEPAEKAFCIAITNAVLALGCDAGFNDEFQLRIMKVAEDIGITKLELIDGLKPDDT